MKENLLYQFFINIAHYYKIVNKAQHNFRDTARIDPLYKMNLRVLEQRISNGWKEQEIALKILNAKDLKIRTVYLSDIVPEYPSIGDKEDQNLMLPNTLYYHNVLRETLAPVFDLETGDLISGGSITRKESFTISDLVNYYLSNLQPINRNRKDLIHVIKYYLSNYRLDDILTAIDFWCTQSSDLSRGNNPWELKEYIFQAIEDRRVLERYGN